jgi:Cft2 family RNA processing exonuclease
MTTGFGTERSQQMRPSSGSKEGNYIRGFIPEGVGTLAEHLPQRAPTMRRLGEFVESAVEALEGGGRAIFEHDAFEVAQQVSQIIKKYPKQALLVGLSVGFLFGRFAFARQ